MMPGMTQPISDDQLAIVPADEASWDDLQTIFVTTDHLREQTGSRPRGGPGVTTTKPEFRA